MELEFSERLRRLPPAVFSKMEELRRDREAQGAGEMINFGLGDPDLKPSDAIIRTLQESSQKIESNRYPNALGNHDLRQAIADWYETRFNVLLDPKSEVLILGGSKEGMAHLPQAFINPGEGILVPSPAYPVYHAATILAGGVPLPLHLREEENYLPNLKEIDRKSLDRAKMIYLGYPSNPTSAGANEEFFNEVVETANKLELIVSHDNAYSEVYYDQKRPRSYLQSKGAKEALGVEFHSFSKSFCLAGFRIGFVVGNKRIIEGLARAKSNIDVGVYGAIQDAAVVALRESWKDGDYFRSVYQSRRDFLCEELKRLKFEFKVPQATFYIWAKVPRGFSSESFTEFLIREAGIIVLPGTGFGVSGQGYVRFALTIPEEAMRVAVKRLEKALSKR